MTTALKPVLRAIDCFEEHLRAPVQVADAAAAAGYSIFHFSRKFSQITRQSPYEYLMRRRLSQAALCLLQSEHRVLDVALDFQFDTPEGFSRAFKKMFGQQPQQLRAQHTVDPRLLMPRLTEDYLKGLRSIPPAPLQENIGPVDLVGWMGVCSSGENDPSALLERVAEEARPYLPGREKVPCYVLTFYLRDWESRGCARFAGVPAESLEKIPVAFAGKHLPAGKYASFSCAGFDSALKYSLSYIFHTWLPHANLSPQVPMVLQRFQWDPFAGTRGAAPHCLDVPLGG